MDKELLNEDVVDYVEEEDYLESDTIEEQMVLGFPKNYVGDVESIQHKLIEFCTENGIVYFFENETLEITNTFKKDDECFLEQIDDEFCDNFTLTERD